jgi:thiol-disulfide isomerase/thioredoxin
MKNSSKIITLLAAAAILAQAGAATLKVGDPAPKLQASKWVQGDPVQEFERDKAYVVEFWATWCGPCVVSIPHVNDLHNKFKDKGLVVIGQDVWEQKQEAVAPFVKKMGDKMTYRVALDLVEGQDKGAMASTWMEAAGQDGIPTAFVVDKQGKIAWIGHPTKLREPLIEQVLEGNYDLRKATAEAEARAKNEQQVSALWSQFQRESRAREWDKAEATLAKMESLLPEEDRDNLVSSRFSLFLSRKDYKRAYALAKKFSEENQDAMALNELAWTIATRPGIERDLDLAEKTATRANTASKGENAEVLDTLARVLFMKGQKAPAIELQEKAVALAQAGRQAQFQKVLDSYKAGKLPDDVRIGELRYEMNESIAQKDWDNAERALAQLESVWPHLGSTRVQILAGRKDFDGAYKLAVSLSETNRNGVMMLNQMAWEIVTRSDATDRELELAEKIGRRADDDSKGTNAEVLDTLARALFRRGDKAEAVRMQERAAQLAKGKRQTQFQATLASYKEGKLPLPY